MGYQFLYVLTFTLFGIAFVVLTVAVLGRILRPVVDTPDEPAKTETYECGEPTVGPSWVRFDIRFYTVALVFLVFDVEVTFLYPWALVFKPLREAKLGGFVFMEAALFLLILGVGFIYCWCKGDLDWVKSSAERVRDFPADRLAKKAPSGDLVTEEEGAAA
jgi:NADH-quinone oxidoreductase subunit A